MLGRVPGVGALPTSIPGEPGHSGCQASDDAQYRGSANTTEGLCEEPRPQQQRRPIDSYVGLILSEPYLFWALLCGWKLYELRSIERLDLPELVVLRLCATHRRLFPWNLEARILKPKPFVGTVEALLARTDNGRDLGMTEAQLREHVKGKGNTWFLYPLEEVRFSGILWFDSCCNQLVFMKPEYPKQGRLLFTPEEVGEYENKLSSRSRRASLPPEELDVEPEELEVEREARQGKGVRERGAIQEDSVRISEVLNVVWRRVLTEEKAGQLVFKDVCNVEYVVKSAKEIIARRQLEADPLAMKEFCIGPLLQAASSCNTSHDTVRPPALQEGALFGNSENKAEAAAALGHGSDDGTSDSCDRQVPSRDWGFQDSSQERGSSSGSFHDNAVPNDEEELMEAERILKVALSELSAEAVPADSADTQLRLLQSESETELSEAPHSPGQQNAQTVPAEIQTSSAVVCKIFCRCCQRQILSGQAVVSCDSCSAPAHRDCIQSMVAPLDRVSENSKITCFECRFHQRHEADFPLSTKGVVIGIASADNSRAVTCSKCANSFVWKQVMVCQHCRFLVCAACACGGHRVNQRPCQQPKWFPGCIGCVSPKMFSSCVQEHICSEYPETRLQSLTPLDCETLLRIGADLLDSGLLDAVNALLPILRAALELELSRGTPSMDHYELELTGFPTAPQLAMARNCIAQRAFLNGVENGRSLASKSSLTRQGKRSSAGVEQKVSALISSCKGDRQFREDGVLVICFLGGEFLDDHATIFLLGSLVMFLHRKYIVYLVNTGVQGSRGRCLDKVLDIIGEEHFIDLSGSELVPSVKSVLALKPDILVNTCAYTSGHCNELWNALSSLASKRGYVLFSFLGTPTLYGGGPQGPWNVVDPIVVPQPGEERIGVTSCYHITSFRDFVNLQEIRALSAALDLQSDIRIPDGTKQVLIVSTRLSRSVRSRDFYLDLLVRLPSSVLVLQMHASTGNALCSFYEHAKQRGICIDRLVVWYPREREEHLARLDYVRQCAEKGLWKVIVVDPPLDPQGAHTMCSEVAFMGLIIVAYVPPDAISWMRLVVKSILVSLQLPQLVTNSVEDLFALILKLCSAEDSLYATLMNGPLSREALDRNDFFNVEIFGPQFEKMVLNVFAVSVQNEFDPARTPRRVSWDEMIAYRGARVLQKRLTQNTSSGPNPAPPSTLVRGTSSLSQDTADKPELVPPLSCSKIHVVVGTHIKKLFIYRNRPVYYDGYVTGRTEDKDRVATFNFRFEDGDIDSVKSDELDVMKEWDVTEKDARICAAIAAHRLLDTADRSALDTGLKMGPCLGCDSWDRLQERIVNGKVYADPRSMQALLALVDSTIPCDVSDKSTTTCLLRVALSSMQETDAAACPAASAQAMSVASDAEGEDAGDEDVGGEDCEGDDDGKRDGPPRRTVLNRVLASYKSATCGGCDSKGRTERDGEGHRGTLNANSTDMVLSLALAAYREISDDSGPPGVLDLGSGDCLFLQMASVSGLFRVGRGVELKQSRQRAVMIANATAARLLTWKHTILQAPLQLAWGDLGDRTSLAEYFTSSGETDWIGSPTNAQNVSWVAYTFCVGLDDDDKTVTIEKVRDDHSILVFVMVETHTYQTTAALGILNKEGINWVLANRETKLPMYGSRDKFAALVFRRLAAPRARVRTAEVGDAKETDTDGMETEQGPKAVGEPKGLISALGASVCTSRGVNSPNSCLFRGRLVPLDELLQTNGVVVNGVIGRGSFGVVFHATWTKGGRRQAAAMKLEVSRHSGRQSPLFAEMYAMSRMGPSRESNNCIADQLPVLKSGNSFGQLLLVDGYFAKVSFTELLTEWLPGVLDSATGTFQLKGRLEASLREAFIETLDAVSFLHGQDFVHLDLKEAHILRDRSGRVKIVDLALGQFGDRRYERTTVSTAAQKRQSALEPRFTYVSSTVAQDRTLPLHGAANRRANTPGLRPEFSVATKKDAIASDLWAVAVIFLRPVLPTTGTPAQYECDLYAAAGSLEGLMALVVRVNGCEKSRASAETRSLLAELAVVAANQGADRPDIDAAGGLIKLFRQTCVLRYLQVIHLLLQHRSADRNTLRAALTSKFASGYIPVSEEEEIELLTTGMLVPGTTHPDGKVQQPCMACLDPIRGLEAVSLIQTYEGEAVGLYGGQRGLPLPNTGSSSVCSGNLSAHWLPLDSGGIHGTPCNRLPLKELGRASAVGSCFASSRTDPSTSVPGNVALPQRLKEQVVKLGGDQFPVYAIPMLGRINIPWGTRLVWDYDWCKVQGGWTLTQEEIDKEVQAFKRPLPARVTKMARAWREHVLEARPELRDRQPPPEKPEGCKRPCDSASASAECNDGEPNAQHATTASAKPPNGQRPTKKQRRQARSGSSGSADREGGKAGSRFPSPPIRNLYGRGTRSKAPRPATVEEVEAILLDLHDHTTLSNLESMLERKVADRGAAYLRGLERISDLNELRREFEILEAEISQSGGALPPGWEEVFLEAAGAKGTVRVGDGSKWLKKLPSENGLVRWLGGVVGRLRPGSKPLAPQALNQNRSQDFVLQENHVDLGANTREGRVHEGNVLCYAGTPQCAGPKAPMCLWVPRQPTRMMLFIGSGVGAHKLVLALYQEAVESYDKQWKAWADQHQGAKEAAFAREWIARMVDRLKKRFPGHVKVEAVMLTVDGPNEGLVFSGLLPHGGSMDQGLRAFCVFAPEPGFVYEDNSTATVADSLYLEALLHGFLEPLGLERVAPPRRR